MNYPVYTILDSEEPPVTLIIPYKEGEPFNPIYACKNDEVLIVFDGRSIGHARIEGAKRAKNDWLVSLDSDGVYPIDYIPRIKYYIRKCGCPLMATIRKGGFGHTFTRVYESGLVARRDYFLEITRNYPRDIPWKGTRTDVYHYIQGAVRIPVVYYHGLTSDEKSGIVETSVIGGLTALYLKERGEEKRKLIV